MQRIILIIVYHNQNHVIFAGFVCAEGRGEVVCKTEYKADSAPAAKLPRIIDSNLFSIYKYIYRGVHTFGWLALCASPPPHRYSTVTFLNVVNFYGDPFHISHRKSYNIQNIFLVFF